MRILSKFSIVIWLSAYGLSFSMYVSLNLYSEKNVEKLNVFYVRNPSNIVDMFRLGSRIASSSNFWRSLSLCI